MTPARRVLVVDDHPDAAEASCLLLNVLGHSCVPALTGEQALIEAERVRPDVVICDIGLPDISGYEVARALRRRHGDLVFLVALSGWGKADDRARSIDAGFDQHYVKPASAKMLQSIVASAPSRAG
jgi:CheY-like chemotaxis protein